MKISKFLVITISCFVFYNTAFAVDVYCPQGFDATCSSSTSCTFSNYKTDNPRLPNLNINGSVTDPIYKNMVLEGVFWEEDNHIFHDSVVCAYKNESGQSLSLLTFDLPRTIKPDTNQRPNRWYFWQTNVGKYGDCNHTTTDNCPLTS